MKVIRFQSLLRGLSAALLPLALWVACPEAAAPPPLSVTLTGTEKSYPQGAAVTPEQLIKEVLLNKTYVEISGFDPKLYQLKVTGPIDTSTGGRKRVPFTVIDIKTQKPLPGTEVLYCIIYITTDTEQTVPSEPTVPLQSIALSPADPAVDIHHILERTVQLKAAFTPPNANQQALFYSVAPDDKATVSADGLVSLKEGVNPPVSVTVTATSAYHADIKTTLELNFTLPDVPITSVSITQGESLRTLQSEVQLTFTVEPADTTHTAFNWTSDNSAVTIDAAGKVTAGPLGGVAKITVTSADTSAVSDFITLTFDILSPDTLTLTGDGDKSLTQLTAADFETDPADPSGIDIKGDFNKKDGHACPVAGDKKKFQLFFKKSDLTDFKYIEFRIKGGGSALNIWTRWEDEHHDQQNEQVSQNPITYLRPTNWGPGWGGSQPTGFENDNNFHIIGFYFDGTNVSCYHNRTYKNKQNAANYFTDQANATFTHFRFQCQESAPEIDYVACYK